MHFGRRGDPVEPPARDGVAGLTTEDPTIVSVSDVHGFLRQARSALLTLRDHPDYDPVVEPGRLNELQWAGGDEYVLVFNGDLIDRGPQSEAVVEMVDRLIEQAPPGHVRVTLGNHEMGLLLPDWFDWRDWYSMTRSDEQRLAFVESIRDGHVVAAYEGYGVTYAHAGLPDPYDVAAVNEEFVSGAQRLAEAIGTPDDRETQEVLLREYSRVFGVDGRSGRGPGAGIAWLDFEHLPADAPRQVVGHTRTDRPVRSGNVICQNVIRNNRRGEGGEAVLVETPEGMVALGRTEDGSVRTDEFTLPPEESA